MKQIILTLCAAIGLGFTGCTCYQQTRTCVQPVREALCVQEEECVPRPLPRTVGCYDSFREPYRISYPQLCPAPEPVAIGNTPGALAIRRNAILRQRESVAFEKGILAASTPITQPSSTGTAIYGETEGAGVFDNPRAPIPCPPAYPGPKASLRNCPTATTCLQPVGEIVVPLGVPVPGKVGYIYCPYGRNSGYIDVRGLAPGSLAKDPYTGRTFRVP